MKSQTSENWNIIVAEDDEDDFFIFKKLLTERKTGHALTWVRDGEELTDYLRASYDYDSHRADARPPIILLDLNMPKKDGREVLQELRNEKALRRIPVVVFTTSISDTDRQFALDLGADAYLNKPMGYSEFERFLDDLLSWINTLSLDGAKAGPFPSRPR